MPIKTFKGLLPSGGQNKIQISTRDGSLGYRIVKFEIMPHVPGDNNDQELICMIWKNEKTATELADNTTSRPNFGNNMLIGTAFYVNDTAGHVNYNGITVFDREVFNQDIFVTMRDIGGSTQDCNYYIELEQMNLDLNQNTLVTLKDIRNTNSN